MLVASLLLIAVLGWQSFKLQQSNAATADSVLREYGILVADEFTRRSTAGIGYRGYYSLIKRIGESKTATEMRSVVSQDETLEDAAKLASGYFLFDGSNISTAGLEMDLELLRSLLQSVYDDSSRNEGPYHSVRSDSKIQQMIYAIRNTGDDSKQVYGFTVDKEGLSHFLQGAFDLGPLLPPSLAGGRLGNDLLFARVTDPAGSVVFETNARYDSNLTINKVLGDDYQGILQGFTIEVSVNPDSASSLVIGGLPESRLPLLFIVMVMVVVLMLSAIWLFRREHAVMKLRTDFVSRVSHELRTPLTQIRMFAETLLLGRVRTEDERRRSLEIIDRESRRLSHLVDNILRFSEISDTISIDRHWQALAPVVREVCDTMAVTANGVTIVLSADESVHANIDADALRQIILNLLDNAVKYGPAQQEIAVSIAGTDRVASISVADQGAGIPEQEREQVWASFYRLKREEKTAISGTGIGLSVVRELVEAMQGRCWIDAPNGGTRVNIEFPTGAGDG